MLFIFLLFYEFNFVMYWSSSQLKGNKKKNQDLHYSFTGQGFKRNAITISFEIVIFSFNNPIVILSLTLNYIYIYNLRTTCRFWTTRIASNPRKMEQRLSYYFFFFINNILVTNKLRRLKKFPFLFFFCFRVTIKRYAIVHIKFCFFFFIDST